MLRVVPSLYRPKCKDVTKQFNKLTDSQWAAISPFLPIARKRKIDLCEVMNAILWLLRTGCQWRNLPAEYPHWQAVYYYFSRWKTDGTLERINRELNQLDRKQQKREAYPSVFCIDSQSRSAGAVKLAPMICEYRGLDAHKKVNAGPPVRPQKRVFGRYRWALMGC
jgi:transposase